MTRPTRLTAFPRRYFDIAQRFEDGERVVVIPCESKKSRAALRLDLYSFRAALEANGMTADYPNFMTFRIKVPADSMELHLFHADEWKP